MQSNRTATAKQLQADMLANVGAVKKHPMAKMAGGFLDPLIAGVVSMTNIIIELSEEIDQLKNQ